ncbi:MAG: hypothetical protein A3D31_02910 [Candidatus Fluviicola riflensis]|nr:MAG: hypothetical protein CHH17_12125 [Candidatus Fluviicola riflensis]OGS78938.1 MAG: hypothetical protein A3D31_02910 [Candidatus Fluviicola riflensis]OGS85960.1 MAG: hypothetical protein A3E30_10395 [Fluviicola sp. RIFCSPHIGHO2_12_FULL_43_24]OGS86369.1 MAG: hypothetical protein A2724_02365 [Fluviicola sp. RIFCSPHIGHO2_01_FULL_43_53]
MIKYVLIGFLFLTFTTSAQEKWGISLSLSNQGQVDQVLNGFYYPAHETAYQDDATEGKLLNLKYNLTTSYALKPNLQCRLRIGFGQRNNESVQDYKPSYWEFNDEQRLLEIAPSIALTEQLGKLTLTGGVELPFYIISEFKQTLYYAEFSDDVMTQYSLYRLSMDGGLIYGVNGFANIRYQLNKRFSFFTELNTGIMRSQLGDKFRSYGTVYPTGGTPTDATPVEFDKVQSKIYFSAIQAQLGLTVHF